MPECGAVAYSDHIISQVKRGRVLLMLVVFGGGVR